MVNKKERILDIHSGSHEMKSTLSDCNFRLNFRIMHFMISTTTTKNKELLSKLLDSNFLRSSVVRARSWLEGITEKEN